MNAVQDLARMLVSEGESNSSLTDAEVQYAIDTVGIDASVAEVRAAL